MGNNAGKIHKLFATPETVHTGFFDSSIQPVLTIESRDTVIFETMTLYANHLTPRMTLEELLALRQDYLDRGVGPHTMTGPVSINGAEPGDVLEVAIKRFMPIDWGVNYQMPGSMNGGGLPEDFPDGQYRTFRFDLDKMETTFSPDISIPLRPFLGVMGVAPRAGEKRPAAIPDYFGGNIDNKELVAGTTLFLPINLRGALFSMGDAHAAQGDGEVNMTAIETAMQEAVIEFTVRKDMKLERPMAETPAHWIIMAFHEDLNEAIKICLRDVTRFLGSTKGLTPNEAYSLASITVNFCITQIVDVNKGVHAMIPKAIFRE